MCELKICRVCLRTETKMYKIQRFHLLSYYEEFMTKRVNKRDGLPHYFCYECAVMLHKFHKFKEKCQQGQKILKELLRTGPFTYERINEVDKKELNLKSPLSVLKVSKRVKTYHFQNTADFDSEEDLPYSEDFDDSDDNVPLAENTNKELQFKYVPVPKYEEPEIFVDTLKPLTDEKPLATFDVKPLVNVDEKFDEDIDMDTGIPSPGFTETKQEDFKPEIELYDATDKSDTKTKQHNFKMPAKLLDPKHWRKVVLSEEEAMEQFKARAVDQKYLSWPFKCVDCLKGFSKEDILKRHRLLRHTENLPLECRFCRSRFRWNNFLRKHMRQHFTKYECLRCNLVCPLESTAIFHDDYHNGVVKKCIHCNLEFTHMTSYYSHLRTHRSEHLCTLCGVSFVSPAGLKRHKKMKHIEDEVKASEDGKEELKTDTFCEKCNIRFETKQAYDVHLLHSAMHLDGIEDKTKDESSIERRLSGNDDLDTKQTDADRDKFLGPPGAPFKYARKQGTKIGYSKKPTDCYQCGKHFESQSACMRHHLAEHPRTSFYPNLERHICEYCGASLAPGSVPQHMNMHTRKKMYPCDTCGRAFYASISLKRHLLTHTGEKPYGCTLCDKRFTQSNAMQLHFRTFHLKEPYPKRNRRKKEKAEEKEESDES